MSYFLEEEEVNKIIIEKVKIQKLTIINKWKTIMLLYSNEMKKSDLYWKTKKKKSDCWRMVINGSYADNKQI